MKPNTNFTLTVQELELIESALRTRLDSEDKLKILDLLGKLHQQKNWYRPKEGYISG